MSTDLKPGKAEEKVCRILPLCVPCPKLDVFLHGASSPKKKVEMNQHQSSLGHCDGDQNVPGVPGRRRTLTRERSNKFGEEHLSILEKTSGTTRKRSACRRPEFRRLLVGFQINLRLEQDML